MQYSKALEQACAILGLVAEAAAERDATMTRAEVNRRLDASPTYLSKILRKLVEAGLITSAPGVRGGYELARAMSEISLLEVVHAIEGTQSFYQPTGLFTRVFNDQGAVERGVSALQTGFSAAEAAWADELGRVTMADIMQVVKTGASS